MAEDHYPTQEAKDRDTEGWELMQGPDPLQRALRILNLDPFCIARKLSEELDACITKASVVDVPKIVARPDGTEEVRIRKEWMYSDPMIDWATRQNARRDLARYWGSVPKEAGSDDSSPLIIRIKCEDAEPKPVSPIK
jgi:hypothetical protein